MAAILLVHALATHMASASPETFALTPVKAVGEVVIGSDHPELAGNQYGFEGGCALRQGNEYHLFVAEMAGDPFWVRMRLAHWKSTDLKNWHRIGTLFESKGKGFESDPKFSIWSPMAVFDDKDSRWCIFYVCYRGPFTPDDGTHRDGQIYRAVSKTPGRDGIDGPYEDAGVLMRPDAESMAWEGQQGVDSFYPYPVGDKWYSHYGSHNYEPISPWRVGLASAPSLKGPWKRLPNSSPLPLEKEFIENPIVTRIGSLYVAIYDSGTVEPGMKYVEDPVNIGYACSRDGVEWSDGKRLAVHTPGETNWSTDIRTPLCLLPMEEDRYAILYTARDKTKLFWNVGLTVAQRIPH